MKFEGEVVPIEVGHKSISELVSEMGETGFQARALSKAVDIMYEMITDSNATVFMGYAGSLSVAGMWKIIRWFIENNYIDALVPTGANISEDILNGMGYRYLRLGEWDDRQLFEEGYNRYYDLAGNEGEYLEMTELIAEFIQQYVEENRDSSGYGRFTVSSREFLRDFGKWLDERGIDCIVSAAYRNGVSIFCPAIIDSPYGDAALIAYSRGYTISIDNVKDYIEFMQLSEKVRDTGVIYIGGGVPKDFIQLFAACSDLLYESRKVPNRTTCSIRKGTDETYYPHKYAVQITSDLPQWGGLSGATLEEGISWGKESRKSNTVTVNCDATIALPIIAHALYERLND